MRRKLYLVKVIDTMYLETDILFKYSMVVGLLDLKGNNYGL